MTCCRPTAGRAHLAVTCGFEAHPAAENGYCCRPDPPESALTGLALRLALCPSVDWPRQSGIDGAPDITARRANEPQDLAAEMLLLYDIGSGALWAGNGWHAQNYLGHKHARCPQLDTPSGGQTHRASSWAECPSLYLCSVRALLFPFALEPRSVPPSNHFTSSFSYSVHPVLLELDTVWTVTGSPWVDAAFAVVR